MSRVSRIIIGLFSLLFSYGIALKVWDNPSVLGWAVLLVFLMISLASFSDRSHPLTLRIIGGAVFSAYAVYLISEFGKPQMWQALRGFIVFGLPGLYVAVFAKYPIWAKAAKVFRSSSDSDKQGKIW